MANKDKVHGEGNYAASREYNDATRKFVESGKVESAARKAAPADAREAESMERAEKIGKGRAKGEDPLLHPQADGKHDSAGGDPDPARK